MALTSVTSMVRANKISGIASINTQRSGHAVFGIGHLWERGHEQANVGRTNCYADFDSKFACGNINMRS